MSHLFAKQQAEPTGPVTCLGQTFASDAERREYYRKLLAEKLKEPAFRAIEGFPQGTDEAILALSDPPYYTACPNPWLADFVREWEAAKPATGEGHAYHREPFAADVSEGKNDPIYNAHSYHTKVPHKAIMRYILHYTEPGDIVFDGFCGTGMTGVAAQMCGDQKTVESLGYRVEADGTVLREEEDAGEESAAPASSNGEANGNGAKRARKRWVAFSRLGARRAVLNDLSPAATFIAYNYNTPVDVAAFEREAKRILAEVEAECGWMYETRHTDGAKGKINYTVWSDVFRCPECASELVFWDVAVDPKAGAVRETFHCPNCDKELSKRMLERAWVENYDPVLKTTIRQAKQSPVSINYSVGKKRFDKEPDEQDIAIIKKVILSELTQWFPAERMIIGREARRNDPIGITHTHHFYSKRNLWVLSYLRHLLTSSNMESQLLCLVGDQLPRASKMHKIAVSRLNTGLSKTAGVLAGTLYIPSNQIEYCPISMIGYRIADISSYLQKRDSATRQVVFASSSENTTIPDDTLDYFFFDPPFGANLNYSELNYLWESWLAVFTNFKHEAIENNAHGKDIEDYRALMVRCFKEAYRILKPGRWMTVEFSNTQASIWNNIQSSISEAGFIVANVSVLDKKQGTFKAVTTPTAVKQDLVISAYKPNGGFGERFAAKADSIEGVWEFVRTHLSYLPVVKAGAGGKAVPVPDRDPRLLFDQVIAYYIRHNLQVPVTTSQEFQAELPRRFVERDGLFYLPEQVALYDRDVARARTQGEIQGDLFVADESSAIQWLRRVLKDKPQKYQDIQPLFLQEIKGWKKTETPLELQELLEQNFICYDGKGDVPPQIHAYLSSNWADLRKLEKNAPALVAKAKDRWYVPDPDKAGDIEKMREKALLRDFDAWLAQPPGRGRRTFRLEAIRAGFLRAWQAKDYAAIVAAAKRLPESALQEDPKLLMYYTRSRRQLDDE